MNLNSLKASYVPLLAALLVGSVAAQSERENKQPKPLTAVPFEPKMAIIGLDAIIGAEVVAAPSGSEPDAKPELLARVSDFVFDGRTGQARAAILAILGDNKKHAEVSWQKLNWDSKHSRFTTSLDKNALEKLPAFDPKKHATGAVDAGEKKGSAVAGEVAPPAASSTSELFASKIGVCDVIAQTEKLGSCGTLFVEPASGSVAFVAVSVGGVLGAGATRYVIPWQALKPAKTKDGQQLQMNKAREDLEGAPELGDPGADLGNAAFRAKIYAFYGVEPLPFERAAGAVGVGRKQ